MTHGDKEHMVLPPGRTPRGCWQHLEPTSLPTEQGPAASRVRPASLTPADGASARHIPMTGDANFRYHDASKPGRPASGRTRATPPNPQDQAWEVSVSPGRNLPTHQPRPAQEEWGFLGSQSLKKDTKLSCALGLQVLLVTFLLLFRIGPSGAGIAPQFSPLDRS